MRGVHDAHKPNEKKENRKVFKKKKKKTTSIHQRQRVIRYSLREKKFGGVICTVYTEG